MANTKAASTKKATAKKPAAAKTTVRTVRATPNPEVKTVVSSASTSRVKSAALPNNIINIVFAELVGTFVLTLVALLAFKETSALYVGLTLSLLVIAIGAVSGSHVNPAVTFGLWTMRKLKTILVPFYWGAQFLGAMLAVIVMNVLANGSVKLNFDHFGQLNWSLMGVELVGMAIFMFGVAAAVSRTDLSVGSRALGVGFSLMVGVLVSGSLLTSVQAAVDTSKITAIADVPHVLRVKGAALNPAVAVAATEATDSSFTGGRASAEDKQYSRLGWEVILGTLVGAALGGNLYLLIAGRNKNS